MLKIHILGGAGSGKTTLAETLGSRFHVPHYDLDKIGWKHGMGPLALYKEKVYVIKNNADRDRLLNLLENF